MADADGGKAPGGGASAGAGLTTDPAALELAMGSASREQADAFLKEQRALIEDQRLRLQEQFKHLAEEYKQLRLGTLEKRLGLFARAAAIVAAVGIAAGIGLMIRDAAQSNELIVDPFSVPPDMAAKGITGEVLAGDMVDRLTALQTRYPNSLRAPQSYANSFGEAIKLQIPETGISFGELDRFLRLKLGSNTHISGALIHTATGLKLSTRIAGAGSDSASGAENELDSLVQNVAEAVYARTQPYRYGSYLFDGGRREAATSVYQALAKAGSAREQAWAYIGLGNVTQNPAPDASMPFLLHALELDPANAVAANNAAANELSLGRWEQALAHYRRTRELLSGSEHGQVRPDYAPDLDLNEREAIDALLGAYREAIPEQRALIQAGKITRAGRSAALAMLQTADHDIGAAEATLRNPLPETPGRAVQGAIANGRARAMLDFAMQDWAGVISAVAALDPAFAESSFSRPLFHLTTDPYVAAAQGKLGHFSQADALIRDMPADCYACLRMRALIAELKGEDGRADWWFARAVQSAPSIPMAYADWGQALLDRGKPDEAIEKFKLAHDRGPHFADPLEMWGEALMAQNRSHLALAEFAEAEKYAPNWGRLHLKWGEALDYAGHKAEAGKQFARAAGLYLSPAEKAALGHWMVPSTQLSRPSASKDDPS